LESLEIIVILVFAATVLLVSFLVKHLGLKREAQQSLDSVRARSTRITANPESNKRIPYGGHMTVDQSQNPAPEVSAIKFESSVSQPMPLDASEPWEPAPAHFELGTTSADSVSGTFQESLSPLPLEIHPEPEGAALFDKGLPMLEEKPSLPLLETQVEPHDEPAAEEARVTDAILNMDNGYISAREEVIAKQLGLLTFYGLIEQPFDVTPDPAYLYRSEVHERAFTSLLQGVQNLRGFLALVAEPGMGKTTLLNKLME
jgi:hypothetical protein